MEGVNDRSATSTQGRDNSYRNTVVHPSIFPHLPNQQQALFPYGQPYLYPPMNSLASFNAPPFPFGGFGAATARNLLQPSAGLPNLQANTGQWMAPFASQLYGTPENQGRRSLGTEADIRMLVEVLFRFKNDRKNASEAIDSLHGVDNHDRNQWFVLYMNNSARIDSRVEQLFRDAETHSSIRHPSTSGVDSQNLGGSITANPLYLTANDTSRMSKRVRIQEHSKIPGHHLKKKRLSGQLHRRRRHRSSLSKSTNKLEMTTSTIAGPSCQRRVDAKKRKSTSESSCSGERRSIRLRGSLNREVTPPSRSPTPPPAPRKESSELYTKSPYTPDDHDFLYKAVRWLVSQDPAISTTAMIRYLAEKASHHSEQSWRSYWSRHTSSLDEIIIPARKRVEKDCTPSYSPQSSDDEEQDSSSETDDDVSNSDTAVSTETETDAESISDFRTMARYIASVPDWDEISTNKKKWDDFAKTHTQRSFKGWICGYNRYKDEIRSLVKKYRRHNALSPATNIPAARTSTTTATTTLGQQQHESTMTGVGVDTSAHIGAGQTRIEVAGNQCPPGRSSYSMSLPLPRRTKEKRSAHSSLSHTSGDRDSGND
ncbi:hypothetical protein C8Q75DRAFT_236841 [Abortiporus biennis]|nr:hypothetical protein C8Q75DRAFT_236841 [Abortiporus biennis]